MDGLKTIRRRLARRFVSSPEYKAKRLDFYNTEIIRYDSRLRVATTSAEKQFCRVMIDMYVKRYNWYLR